MSRAVCFFPALAVLEVAGQQERVGGGRHQGQTGAAGDPGRCQVHTRTST